MRTHKNITNGLERMILAGALNTFRNSFKKRIPTTASRLVYPSSVEGFILDECVIDVANWKLIEVNYDKWENDKIVRKTIKLSP